jgi:hypothetical protein
MRRRHLKVENRLPTLFEQETPRIDLSEMQRAQLAKLLEALFDEIAAALATREAGDDQDHR